MANRMTRTAIAVAALGAAAWAAGHVYIATHRTWPEPAPADAVLVLGTSSLVNGEPNPCMRARVAEGVRLVKDGLAPLLIVSGGFDPRDGMVEADTMAEIAVGLGLEPEQIMKEDRSTSTIENLTFSLDLLADVDTPSMVVVTEPFHLPRAVMAADRLGVRIEPVPSATCHSRDHTWILREPVALWWYWVKLGQLTGISNQQPATSDQ